MNKKSCPPKITPEICHSISTKWHVVHYAYQNSIIKPKLQVEWSLSLFVSTLLLKQLLGRNNPQHMQGLLQQRQQQQRQQQQRPFTNPNYKKCNHIMNDLVPHGHLGLFHIKTLWAVEELKVTLIKQRHRGLSHSVAIHTSWRVRGYQDMDGVKDFGGMMLGLANSKGKFE